MSALLERREPSPEIILRKLKPPFEAAMVFGSVAREMSADDSDIDVLQLVSSPMASYKEGRYSVSVYPYLSLKNMALQGNLFVLHLKLEGRIISDPKGLLCDC